MKNYFFTLAIALLIASGCTFPAPDDKLIDLSEDVSVEPSQQAPANADYNDELICVTEPGQAIYPGTEKCCGDLISIFGTQLEDGSCWCTEKDNNCGGAPICAPCGNDKCEKEYKEDKCNCPSDCS
jgi:hypothetical protein